MSCRHSKPALASSATDTQGTPGTTATPSRWTLVRMAGGMWRQGNYSPQCPDTPRLDGKTALVTGANGGIGLETARGLHQRGAHVLLACRSEARARAAMDDIAGTGTSEGQGNDRLSFVQVRTRSAAVDTRHQCPHVCVCVCVQCLGCAHSSTSPT